MPKKGKRRNRDVEFMDVYQMTSRDFQKDVYAHVETAGQFLRDKPTIKFFREAIVNNMHLIRGKVVLNIGCGVGILSLFAAKAGASQVYAVDCSNAIDYAHQIVAANGYSNIKLIKGRIQDIELPTAEVDVIICDWMGYSLLFQSICDAVIFARDKWLKKKTGTIIPDKAELYMNFFQNERCRNERIEWWSNVYGFPMRCLRDYALSEPCFQHLHPHEVITSSYCLKTLNLYTASCDDLKFRSKYMVQIKKSGHIDGLFTYFDVHFDRSHTPISLSTSPAAPVTQWAQTLFFFDNAISVNVEEYLYGGIELCCTSEHIDLNNLLLNFEILKGDPNNLDLICENQWILKNKLAIDTKIKSKASKENIHNETTSITNVSVNKSKTVKVDNHK